MCRTQTIHRALLGVLAATVAVTPAVAAADVLTAFAHDDVVETSHTVAVDLDDGLASLRVRRTLVNRAHDVDGAQLAVDLPDGAIATDLSLEVDGQAHDGELLDIDEATSRFHDPGAVNDRPRQAAMLSRSAGPDTLYLEVCGLMPDEPITVEYTLQVPLTYDEGVWSLVYPRGTDDALPVPTVSLARDIEGATIEDEDGLSPLVTVPARGIDTVDTWLGHATLDSGHSFARLSVAAAPQLRPMPERATVVLLVDASHSIEPTGVERQLAIARSMVGQLPDAHVQIVVYRRFAERVFERPVLGRELDAQLTEAIERGAFEPGNGSALDLALAEAVDIVAEREPGTAARIVAMTDELLRPGWSNQTVLDQTLASLDDDAVLHVVNPVAWSGGTQGWRDDQASLAELAAGHGGVFWFVRGLDEPGSDLDGVTLALIRPLRIDHLRIEGLDSDVLEAGADALPDHLDEGRGWSTLVGAEAPLVDGPVVLHGQLWSTPWQTTLERDAARDRATAGFVFAEGFHHELDDSEQLALAQLAGTVTPVTSLFVQAADGAPSEVMAGFGVSATCCGPPMSMGGVGTAGHGAAIDTLELVLDDELEACLATLPDADIADGAVELAVDTTLDEIVDVQATPRVDDEDARALADCLVEATWSHRLESGFFRTQDHFGLALP